MEWAAEDAASLVDVCASVDECLGCLVVFLADSETEWCALVLVEYIRVNLVHQEAIDDASVSVGSCLMQNGPLPIVCSILVEVVLGEVLQKCDECTLMHLVFDQ